MTAPSPAVLADLRLRAAVLSHFELDWLGVPAPDDEAADEATDEATPDLLLAESERVEGPDGKRHWALDDAARRGAVAAAGFDALRRAWASVRHRPEDDRQWAIDRYVGTLDPPPLERLTPARLRSVQWLCGWLGGAAPHVPTAHSIRLRLDRDALLAPLRHVVGDHFVGREELLARLDEPPPGARPVLVHGIGGVGKSAVLGRHLLGVADRGGLVGYLTFDHTGLDAARPAGLLAALATQLAAQLPEALAADAEALARRARNQLRTGDRAFETSGRAANVTAIDVGHLVAALGKLTGGRRYAVVFDTVEEVQRRDRSALALLADLLRELSTVPGATVVLAGRSPAPELLAEPVPLPGLPRPEAVTLLRHELKGLAGGVDLDRVVDEVGTSPLCLRLAAGVLRHAPGDEALRDLALRRGTVEGELYRRLLGHIPDPAVRRLAHPGLTLRRITPQLIRRVLAGPCGVPVPDEATAERLFGGLAREAMLVEREPGLPPTLVHRPDVRRMMLRRLAEDEPEAVLAIHRRAVSYYAGRKGLADRVEELYHRLMLGQDGRTLDRHWDPEALPGLVAALDELPPVAKAYLAAKSRTLSVSDEDLRQADRDVRRALVLRRARTAVAAGRVKEALHEVDRHAAETGDDHLDLAAVRIQALELAARLYEALSVAVEARRRSVRAGTSADFFAFTVHVARLQERVGRLPEADALLTDALAQVRTLPPGPASQITRLVMVVCRLRLIRHGVPAPPAAGEALADEAVTLFHALPERLLADTPGLLRDLAAEVGLRSPDIQRAALRTVGLKATPGGALADALATVDERASADRGLDSGAAAGTVDIDEDQDWGKWVAGKDRSDLGEQISHVVDAFPEAWAGPGAEAVTETYQQESDAAVQFRVDPD